jgi:hypothetical protein
MVTVERTIATPIKYFALLPWEKLSTAVGFNRYMQAYPANDDEIVHRFTYDIVCNGGVLAGMFGKLFYSDFFLSFSFFFSLFFPFFFFVFELVFSI